MKNNGFNLRELVFYYVIIFFLLREWLVPLLELTKTGFIGYMMVFIAMCLLMTLIRIPFYITWSIKFLYIIWFIVFVYGEMSVFSTEGISFLLSDFQVNVSYILQAEWWNVTNPFKTFLFMILLWMLVFLIHHWVNVRMSIYAFLLLTVTFIAALDTFTPYDGFFAIVRVIFLGLVLSASLLLKQLIHKKSIKIRFTKYINLVVPIVFLVAFVSGIAFLIPKPDEPKWPDPVPFIKAATSGKGDTTDDGKSVVKKVGYGENDDKLGGGFVADDTAVFLADASSKQYWRVETKDTYTSKGWENSFESMETFSSYLPGETIVHSIPLGKEEDADYIKIQNLFEYNFIVQPYGLMTVELTNEDEYGYADLSLNGNEKLYAISLKEDENIFSTYFVQYSNPTYRYNDLLKTTIPVASNHERFLQLPTTLPDRVRDLAAEIVSGKESSYEKARAIETYFKQNGFKYRTEDIAIPEDDQDYVDQFLFETKVGYCDNFSTAMVVMLRSVGIPARWVKGFSPGEVVGTNGDLKTYKVTNNDAHSWVEAYFPEVGWVNFEPTIGFTGNRNIEIDNETALNQQNDELVKQEQAQKEEIIKEEEKELKKVTSPKSDSQLAEKTKAFMKEHTLLLIICSTTILLVILMLFLLRKKWMPKLSIAMQRKKEFDETNFESYYLKLLKILEMKGFKRKQGQTLEAFAKEIDQRFNSNHMSILTKNYEQLIYSNAPIQLKKTEMKECWEYLIKQSTS